MIDDNDSSLEESRIDKQRAAMMRKGGEGGATMTVRDSRVSSFIEWMQPIVTGGVLAGIVYFANQVGSLRDAVVDTNKQMALTLQQNTRLIEDVRDHELRIRTLEGRTLRGSQEPVLLPSEERRGH